MAIDPPKHRVNIKNSSRRPMARHKRIGRKNQHVALENTACDGFSRKIHFHQTGHGKREDKIVPSAFEVLSENLAWDGKRWLSR